MENFDKFSEELSLILLYIHSFKEKGFETSAPRSWKGYDFSTLDRLSQQGYVIDKHSNKSLAITDEGIEKAKELLKKYGIEN